MADCKSFSPHIDKNAKILVLGSMPGVKSLQAQEYYAHPQNRFWKLIGIICGCEKLADEGYAKKLKILQENGIALWDVIGFCTRNGSLDSDIENEKPNDIEGLLKKFGNIKTICLNGNKAYSAFKKYFPKMIEKYCCYKMPSTSPANAKFRLDDLYNEWSKAFDF